MNSFAAIASLLAASAFVGIANADSQRQIDKAQTIQAKAERTQAAK